MGASRNCPSRQQTYSGSNSPLTALQLTDGLCSSACALFVELMSHQAGVRTIVVGGLPAAGPMQTASGNRGARTYSSDALNLDYKGLHEKVNNSEAYSRLPPPSIWNDTGMWVNHASFNIRDVVRPNDTTPLQFKYEAAQCRMYYTLSNVYNMTRLWLDAAAATWFDTSLCVQDSTGYATGPDIKKVKLPPARTAQIPFLDMKAIDDIHFYSDPTGALIAGRYRVLANDIAPQPCGPSKKCGSGTVCEKLFAQCLPVGSSKKIKKEFCVQSCSSVSSCTCAPMRGSESKQQVNTLTSKADPRLKLYDGYCIPPAITPVQC